MHMKNGIYKCHYSSYDAKVSLTRDLADKGSSVTNSSQATLA